MATCRYLHVNNMVHQNTKQTSCRTVWPAAIRPTRTTRPESKCREIGRYSTRAECEAGIRCSPNTNAGQWSTKSHSSNQHHQYNWH